MNTSIPQVQLSNYNRSNVNFKKASAFKYLTHTAIFSNKNNILAPNKSLLSAACILGGAYITLYNLIYGVWNFNRCIWCYEKEITQRMKKDIIEADKKYNLNFDFGGINNYGSNKAYIWMTAVNRANKDKFILNFDRKTGALINIRINENKHIRIKNDDVTISIPTDTIEIDTGSIFDSEKTTLYGNATKVTDSNGNLIRATEFAKSNIDGEFNVNECGPDGKCYNTGIAEFDGIGGKHVEKHFVSPDGTITDYVFADDKNGNRYLYYKITDNQGQILYESKETHKSIDDNHFISTKDEISYDIQFSDDKVVATRLDSFGNKTNDNVIYNIKKYSQEEREKYRNIHDKYYHSTWGGMFGNGLVNEYKENNAIEPQTIDKDLVPILKQLSGEEWFALKNNGVENIRIGTWDKDNAHSLGSAIEIGENYTNHLCTLEHELGHEKFRSMNICKDKELKDIFMEERSLCYDSLPKIEINQMKYLIHNNEGLERSLSETVAEINQLIHVPNSDRSIAARGIYLMKYFPRTIAYVANKYNANISA